MSGRSEFAFSRTSAQADRVFLVEPFGSHVQARRGAERKDSVTEHVRLIRVLYPCQYGLTSAKPYGCMSTASQDAARTAALCLSAFLETRHLVMQGQTSTQRKCKLQLPPKRNAIEKKKTRHAARRRGGEGVAITHGPCDPEPWCKLH